VRGRRWCAQDFSESDDVDLALELRKQGSGTRNFWARIERDHCWAWRDAAPCRVELVPLRAGFAVAGRWAPARIFTNAASDRAGIRLHKAFRRPTKYCLYLRGSRKHCGVENQARRCGVGEISGL